MNNSATSTGARSNSPSRAFRLQERDVAIVAAVHRHRVLSTEQVAAVFFPTASGAVSTACRSRLRHLVNAGYLERAEQEQVKSDGRKPHLFMLSSAGAELLVDELGFLPEDIDWQPEHNNVRWPFLRHQLEINDVFVALSLAVGRIGWSIERWVDDRILRQQHTDRVTVPGEARSVAVVPDAYFVLAQRDTFLHFFLEVDRATMAVAPASRRTKSWQRRIQAYQAFFASDAIIDRYRTRRIRVMTVTTGERRLENLKTATEAVGGQRRYWFTTTEELSPDSVLTADIWRVGGVEDCLPLIRQS